MRGLYDVYDTEHDVSVRYLRTKPEETVHYVEEPDSISCYAAHPVSIGTTETIKSIQGIKSNRDKVLYILSSHPSMTLDEVAKHIGLSRIGVQKIVGKLKQEGLLVRKGSNKTGEWIVMEGI